MLAARETTSEASPACHRLRRRDPTRLHRWLRRRRSRPTNARVLCRPPCESLGLQPCQRLPSRHNDVAVARFKLHGIAGPPRPLRRDECRPRPGEGIEDQTAAWGGGTDQLLEQRHRLGRRVFVPLWDGLGKAKDVAGVCPTIPGPRLPDRGLDDRLSPRKMLSEPPEGYLSAGRPGILVGMKVTLSFLRHPYRCLGVLLQLLRYSLSFCWALLLPRAVTAAKSRPDRIRSTGPAMTKGMITRTTNPRRPLPIGNR